LTIELCRTVVPEVAVHPLALQHNAARQKQCGCCCDIRQIQPEWTVEVRQLCIVWQAIGRGRMQTHAVLMTNGYHAGVANPSGVLRLLWRLLMQMLM
jgi:hypothetical protein